MTDIPILFSAPMVLAMLEGRKTQTRRLAWGKHFPVEDCDYCIPQIRSQLADHKVSDVDDLGFRIAWRPSRLQKARKGDRLWVRETHHALAGTVTYRASSPDARQKWTPAIHMNRWCSRLTLELVEDPRVECLHAITNDDAQAEGAIFHDGRGVGHSGYRHDPTDGHVYRTPRESFHKLWSRVHGDEESWNGNPDVIVLTFKVHKMNIDTHTEFGG